MPTTIKDVAIDYLTKRFLEISERYMRGEKVSADDLDFADRLATKLSSLKASDLKPINAGGVSETTLDDLLNELEGEEENDQ
ncbi:hypothetical protein PLEI_1458 [Photobacterium leiognathi lrivu.4.1]|uniref:Uncharacterized protein n=1 Tax=Photobacterium leiognathi lrivu.4.1 TaxID=1248232 RepID=A0A0U1P5S3_PHOLE|nr:hypothetical protein [Photobacterium leiognathi]GAD29805.1 hypothetical protein PLEI_1458 [Photobacterium leiognathi lrivu.4.1]